MRETTFENGEFYHVYHRGLDKRKIFRDNDDYERFCESICLFNDPNFVYSPQKFDKFLQLSVQDYFGIDGDPYVKIAGYALMPNHYHFFLQQVKSEGISKFFHKLNKGYSNYFNRKNKRSGALFEGNFKAKHINNDAYYDYILFYIHLNALDLTNLRWRDGEVDDWEEAMRSIDDYKWTSHNFYKSKTQKYPIVDSGTACELLDTLKNYEEELMSWPTRNLNLTLLGNVTR